MDMRLVSVLLTLSLVLSTGVDAIGLNYATVAYNLPDPKDVVGYLRKLHIDVKDVKTFAPIPDILQAFNGTEFSLVVGVLNDDVAEIGASRAAAVEWVRQIVPYAGNIKTIAVGNEIFHSRSDLIQPLVPAMRNIRGALHKVGLGRRIQVTTVVAGDGQLISNFYPPSAGAFQKNQGLDTVIPDLLRFLSRYNYPFMLNIHPYFGWRMNQKVHPIDFALFRMTSPRYVDEGRAYYSLFDAIYDCVVSALEKEGHGKLKVVVSESGWPTGPTSVDGASVENAHTYNQGLVNHVKVGTPKRPGPIEAYIYNLFNEDKRTDADPIEKHWGIMGYDGTPAYSLVE